MKFRIVRGVPAEKLSDYVQCEFVERLPPRRKGERFALILFRSQRDPKRSGVILSSVAEQAIARLGQLRAETALACGGDFTEEARTVLEANGVTPISLGNFHWTDETYKQIKE